MKTLILIDNLLFKNQSDVPDSHTTGARTNISTAMAELTER